MSTSIAASNPFAITQNLGWPLPRPALHLTERIAGRLLALDRCRTIYDGIPANLPGRDFLDRLVQELGVSLAAGAGELQRIPAAGPTIVVANHPFGAMEGILLAEGDFDMLPYGVATARRAWIEAKDVINCWPKDKLLKWLKST